MSILVRSHCVQIDCKQRFSNFNGQSCASLHFHSVPLTYISPHFAYVLREERMSLDDSAEDLFITQSTFSVPDENVAMQDADEAAQFLLDTSVDLTPNSCPEVVEYMDFSHKHAKELLKSAIDAVSDQKPADSFVPLMPDLFDDDDLEKVDDDVLTGALDLDAVLCDGAPSDHHGEPVSAEEANDKKCKGYSNATKCKLQRAYHVYFDWKVAHNCCALQNNDQESFIGNIFEMDAAKVCTVVTKFLLEVCKKNGEVYPSDTIYELVLSLQMYLLFHGCKFKFIDNHVFEPPKNTLDNHMQELAKEGKHCPWKKADVISIEDENCLCDQNVLGDTNPKQLLDTVLYQLRVHFALRAGSEHCDLKLGDKSHFSIKYDSQAKLEYLQYVEDTSKNNRGDISHRRVDSKVVRAYENNANPEHCIVRLFRKYMSLHPTGEKVPDDFYLHPLLNWTDSTWYTTQPVGKNKLSTMWHLWLKK